MEKLILEKRKQGLSEVITNDEIELLNSGVPIQKIIGFIDFDDLRISVSRNVLIPRYETQEVVNKALSFIKENDSVLDLCSGSGYIGLTIKQKCETCNVTLSDLENESILQSKENAKNNGLEVEIIQSDMFENIHGKFNLIISNPPYIPNNNNLDNSILLYEPRNALFGGEDGNDFYKNIIENVKKYLVTGGILVLEISEDNVKYIKSENFNIQKDINGKNRIAWKHF